MKGDIRAVAPRGGDAAAVLRLKLERCHREDVQKREWNKNHWMTALWLYGRGRAAHQPAPLKKVSGANAPVGWGGGATCFRGLRLSSDSSAAPGIKRPRVQHGLLMWLHLGGWGIIPSVWVSESSEARKHEPAHFRTLLSVVCNGKVWQSLEKEEANGGVTAPTSLVSRKTSQIRIRAGWDGVAWIPRPVWKEYWFSGLQETIPWTPNPHT